MIIVRWFFSQTVRRAVAMRKHVGKLLAAQRDILSPQAIEAMNGAIASLKTAVEQGTDKVTLLAQMDNLEKAANKWLKPYPNAAYRENVEVFLVALAVAMGIRTFVLQPFKIPTGSMQPTLYGVTGIGNKPDLEIPNRLARFCDYWIHGESYFHIIAPDNGQLERVLPAGKFLLFNLKQQYVFNGQTYTVWFPADNLFDRAGFRVSRESGEVSNSPIFQRGQDIVRLKVVAGDHLFVNRITYNFRHPKRGEIIVFSTAGIDPIAIEDLYRNTGNRINTNQYYIKRLVALGGERVQIGSDQHLIINGQRLDSSTPHFEDVYNFRLDAKENEYFGHTPIAMFAESSETYTVQTNRYMVMGDNTRNSLDSRFFGDFSRESVIGKSSFVYWPISSRFGFGYH